MSNINLNTGEAPDLALVSMKVLTSSIVRLLGMRRLGDPL